jgi:hypothetical protein
LNIALLKTVVDLRICVNVSRSSLCFSFSFFCLFLFSNHTRDEIVLTCFEFIKREHFGTHRSDIESLVRTACRWLSIRFVGVRSIDSLFCFVFSFESILYTISHTEKQPTKQTQQNNATTDIVSLRQNRTSNKDISMMEENYKTNKKRKENQRRRRRRRRNKKENRRNGKRRK